jgi:hypothetical protein
MILIIVVSTNMFFDAVFWQARAPNSKPPLLDILFFGIVCAAINVPAIMFFQTTYQTIGAKIQTFEKHILLGKHIVMSPIEDHYKKINNIKSHKEAVEFGHLIDGAIYYLKHHVKKDKSRYKWTDCCIKTRRKRENKTVETPRYVKERRLRLSQVMQGLKANPGLRRKKLQDFIALSARAKSISKELQTKEKREEEEHLERYKLKHSPTVMKESWWCCRSYRITSMLKNESKRFSRLKELSKMSKNELKIRGSLSKKNFFVRKLFHINKSFRDPKMIVQPSPHWIRYFIDILSVLLVAFNCYFIVSFSFYYGPAVANAWLQCFLTSMLLDMLLVAPITVLFKSVMLPKVVAKLVFDEPDLAPLAATPLMTGAVSQFGPTGQMALAMGLVSTAAVGAASSIAFKWRQRVQRRLQERKQGLEPGVETFVRYVAESPRLLSNGNVTGSKYVVKAIRSIKRTKFKKLNAVEVNIGDADDADDALVVGGNKYAVVPRHRHEVDEFRRQSLNSPEKSFQSPVIASPKTAIVDVKQLQGRVDRHDGAITKLHFESEESVPLNKKNRVSRYSVLLDASTEGKENEEEDRLKQVTNQGDSTKSLHNVTHDHVLDLIMHLTERQLNVLAVNDAHENVKKKNEALQATEKKQVEKNAQQDTFKDRRLMMALRHQEELDLMPETSFHRDRKKRWNTVKNKIIKKASAERARKDFMEELQHPDQPSSSIEWARILKAGREKMGKEMEERRRAFMLATSMSKDTNDTIRKIEDKRKKEAKKCRRILAEKQEGCKRSKKRVVFGWKLYQAITFDSSKN